MVARVSTRTWLQAGVVGPVLFVAVFLVEGATRPGYDPVRTFVSELSLGDGGWLQIASFLVTGALVLGFAVGLGRAWAPSRARWAPRLIGLVGVSLMICGAFVADPALGYPAGAPAGLPTETSWHAGIHYLGALGVFLGLPAAAAIAARHAEIVHVRRWAIYSLVSGAVMLVGWVLTFLLRGADGTLAVAGLLQRIAIVGGFQWLVVTALLELRHRAFVPAPAPAPAAA
ncbi:MAG TPA: DUF998 domain-containing protein [Candidatus Limnocylindrales bacterium]